MHMFLWFDNAVEEEYYIWYLQNELENLKWIEVEISKKKQHQLQSEQFEVNRLAPEYINSNILNSQSQPI